MTEARNDEAPGHPVQKMDRRVKLWLLIVSATTIGLLAAAALRENVFADWRRLRGQYLEILETKASDVRGQAAAREFEVRLVQNYIPELGAADRCLTCHPGVQDPRMTGERLPFRTHPGRYLDIHDPEKFGCTVCHSGQGRATETADAHGRVPFWDFPMLENTLVRSSCTKCHIEADLFGQTGLIARADGQTKVVGAELLERGRTLVRESGCLGCHSMSGKGGAAGPDLSEEGNKTHHDFSFGHFEKSAPREVAYWLEKHFLDPAAVSPGTIMPPVPESGEAKALVAYMLSRRRREIGRYYYTKGTNGAAVESGRDLYARYCSACHGPEGKGGRVASIRTPTLNQADVLAVASDGFYRTIIEKGRSATRMPAWGAGYGNLGPDEVDRIITHLRSWEPKGPGLSDISARSGDPETGQQKYQRLCGSCHGMNGEGGIGSVLNSAPFLAVADDRFLAESIVNGRPGTAMPSWKQLSAQNVSDLLAFIRTWQGAGPSFQAVQESLRALPREEGAREGRRLYEAHCASCHGGDAEGGLGPSLSSPDFLGAVDDEYLYRAITEGRPSTAMPASKHLAANEVASLLRYFRTFQNGTRLVLNNRVPLGDHAAGKMYYDVACASCHGTQGSGGSGPQLANQVFQRSVSDVALFHWIAQSRPNTTMRGFLGDAQGVTRLTASQLGDVIAYIRHLGTLTDPPTMRTGAGDPKAGGELFARHCASCHGPEGEGGSGSQLNNPAFLGAASDGLLAATLLVRHARDGRPPSVDTQARKDGPGDISIDNVRNLIAFMRLWEQPVNGRKSRPVAERSDRAVASGAEKFGRYCAPCHGPNGRGEIDGPAHFAPALNNPEFLQAADDGFLVATIARGRAGTQMIPFGEGAGGGVALKADEMKDIVSFMRSWQKPGASSKGAPDKG